MNFFERVYSCLAASFPKRFLKRSSFSKKEIEEIKKKSENSTKSYCFFFSSAGEYEQGLPILEVLRKRSDVFVYLIFFSKSGFSFAQKKETLPRKLFPGDSFSVWKPFFSAFKNCETLIIRHEIWPIFITCAFEKGQVYLLNASHPSSSVSSFKKFLYSILFKYFNKIFVVDSLSSDKLRSLYSLSNSKILISGDTKYDRVLQRKSLSESLVKELKKYYDLAYTQRKQTLVAGSVWWEDCQRLLVAFSQLKHLHKLECRLLLVPHQLKAPLFQKIQNLCENLNLVCNLDEMAYETFSKVGPQKLNSDVIIVNRMGLLAETYCLGNLAYVGGVFHSRVHNVLEPVAYGTAVSFGPLYKTSHEAEKLLENNLAEVIRTIPDIVNWCSYHYDAKFTFEIMLLKYLDQQKGATRTVFTYLGIHDHRD